MPEDKGLLNIMKDVKSHERAQFAAGWAEGILTVFQRGPWKRVERLRRAISPTKRIALEGTLWIFLGFGLGQALRLISSVLLTRLLSPDLFGLMAIVTSVLVGLHLFSDIGLGASVIRHKRGDEPTFLNTVWTLQVMRGVALWLLCMALAYPVAQLYADPRLYWLLPLVGFNSVLLGFNSTAIFTLNRHLAVRQLVLLELAGQLIGLTVTLSWAYLQPSVLAIVAGSIAGTLFQLVWSHSIKAALRHRFALDRHAAGEILSFGKWIFLSTIAAFLATQSDRLTLGKFFTLDIVGVYGLALALAAIPYSIVAGVSNKVIFPSFAKLIDLPREDLRAKIQRSRIWVLLGGAVGMSVIVGFGDYAVHILYDRRYADAAWMMPLLALGTWPNMVVQTLAPALYAAGKPQFVTVGNCVNFVTLTGGIILGTMWREPLLGAVIGITVSSIPSYIIITYGLWRERLSFVSQDLSSTLLFLVSLVIIYGGRLALGFQPPLRTLWN